MSPNYRREAQGFYYKHSIEKIKKIKEDNEVSCITEDSLVLDEVPLDLYFIDWLEIRSSGKRLGLYFTDWLAIRSSQSPFSSS